MNCSGALRVVNLMEDPHPIEIKTNVKSTVKNFSRTKAPK
jgi:hypothetical protein